MLSRWCVALLFLLFSGTAMSQDVRTEVWSTTRLDLVVTIDPAAKRMSVTGTVALRLEDPESDGPALILNERAKSMRYRRITANGVEATVLPYPKNPAIEVALFTLPESFRKNDALEVAFETEFETPSSQLTLTESAALASWVERWYPVPATIQDGPASPSAPGSTTFRLPRSWRSVSNGRLVSSETRDGLLEERWETDTPAARSFTAAPYRSVESVTDGGRTISFYMLKPRPSARAQATALSKAIDAMERHFGPYPFGSYNVAEVPEASFAAASEQGFIMVRGDLLDSEKGNLPLFAHEAGHGWWGNLVRGDRMLSEALAQYGAVLSIEALEGVDARNEFLRFSREGYNPLQCALGYFYIWREGGDEPLAQLGDGPHAHNLSDSKGMWFYHMLRLRVGDEIFYSTLRSIIRDFAGREPTLDDLRSRFVAAAPADGELKSFLAQWLDRSGAPVLRVEWWSVDRGKAAEIDVEQLQPGDPFRFPLEVEVRTASGASERHLLEVSKQRETFKVPAGARPLALTVDPQHRVLLWRPEYGPRPSGTK
jgi:aminopeptidase N